jgi:hypothetical protein
MRGVYDQLNEAAPGTPLGPLWWVLSGTRAMAFFHHMRYTLFLPRQHLLLLANVAAASPHSSESAPCGGQLLPLFLGSQLQLAHPVTIELGLPSCIAQPVDPFSQVGILNVFPLC